MYKTDTKIKQSDSEQQLLLSQSWKSDHYMGGKSIISEIEQYG